MKKFIKIYIVLFILVLTFSISSASLCYADTYDKDVFYETTKDLDTYFENGSSAIIIPYTYYFKVTGENETYYIISYNNITLYILKADFTSKTKVTTLTSINNPYYNIELTSPTTPIDLYDSKDFQSPGKLTLTELNFIGYTKHNEEFYFYVSSSIFGSNVNGFVKAEDVITNFNPSSIPLHPNSQELQNQIKEEQNKLAENNLKRNIFIFVVAALAIVIVFLIYNPFTKKKEANIASSHTSEDDY